MRISSVIVVSVASIALLAPSHVHAAGTQQLDLARESFRLINNERSSRGLARLAWSDTMAGVARRHSAKMADEQDLHHNPNLAADVRGWQRVGENVGVGGTIEQLHEALMASQSHRANILGRYEQAGTGVVADDDGQLWLTQVFYTPMRSSSSSVQPRRTTRATTSARPKARPTRTATARPTRRPAAARPVPVASRAPVEPATSLRFYRSVGSYTRFSR